MVIKFVFIGLDHLVMKYEFHHFLNTGHGRARGVWDFHHEENPKSPLTWTEALFFGCSRLRVKFAHVSSTKQITGQEKKIPEPNEVPSNVLQTKSTTWDFPASRNSQSGNCTPSDLLRYARQRSSEFVSSFRLHSFHSHLKCRCWTSRSLDFLKSHLHVPVLILRLPPRSVSVEKKTCSSVHRSGMSDCDVSPTPNTRCEPNFCNRLSCRNSRSSWLENFQQKQARQPAEIPPC